MRIQWFTYPNPTVVQLPLLYRCATPTAAACVAHGRGVWWIQLARLGLACGHFHAGDGCMVYAVSPTYPCERRAIGGRRNERSADGTVSVYRVRSLDHRWGPTSVERNLPRLNGSHSTQPLASMRSASGCGESERVGKTFRPDSKGGPAVPPFLGTQRLFHQCGDRRNTTTPPTPGGN